MNEYELRRHLVEATVQLSFMANENTLAARNLRFRIEEMLHAIDEWWQERQAAPVELD